MDRTLVAALALALSLVAFSQTRGAEVACHWDDPGLRAYLGSIYGGGMNTDSPEDEYYSGLEQHRETNLVCLREIVLHGPKIVPGLEQDLEAQGKQIDPSKPGALPLRGLAVLPAIIALDPAGGHRLVESQIADTGLTNSELVVLASQLLPPPSAAARAALRKRLSRNVIDHWDIAALMVMLLRFSERSDAALIRGHLALLTKRERIDVEARLHARLGETSQLRKALASPDRLVANWSADALLSWGYARDVCSFLGSAKAGERLQTIASIYEGYKTGQVFNGLPDAVVAKIQAAPHAWDCVPPGVALPPYVGPRDVSHDPAAVRMPRSARSRQENRLDDDFRPSGHWSPALSPPPPSHRHPRCEP